MLELNQFLKRENEVDYLAKVIHNAIENNEGYIIYQRHCQLDLVPTLRSRDYPLKIMKKKEKNMQYFTFPLNQLCY